MVALVWDQTGERFYEAGVDRGVFYPLVGAGVAWNGLVSVNETVSGGDKKPIHIDGIKKYDIVENEDFQAEIEAFSAPEEFRICDGMKAIATGLYVTQQPRSTFGFSYRTLKGNDLEGNEYGYNIHLVYNATASPSTRTHKTIGEAAEAVLLKWIIDSVPVSSTTYKPSGHLMLDSTKIAAGKMTTIENSLYGTPSTNPTLLTPSAIVAILTAP